MTDNPFDFSKVEVAGDPYDFSDVPVAPAVRRPLSDPLRRQFAELLDSAGIININDEDPHGWRFFEDPASTTAIPGATAKPNIPVPERTPEAGPDLVGTFKQKYGEMAPDIPGGTGGKAAAYALGGPLGVAATAGAGIAAAAATAGELLTGFAGEAGVETREFDPEENVAEQGWGLIRNTGASFANLGAGILQMPEALVRDPGGTMLGLLEFIPHQAITAYKAVAPGIAHKFGFAVTEEMKAEQKAALKELYQDPLGPVFAALMTTGIVRGGAKVARRYKTASDLAKLDEKISADVARETAAAERKAAFDRIAEMQEARAQAAPPPNVPTRSLTTTREGPVAGPITDPSRLIEMKGPKGETVGPEGGFVTHPSTKSQRIPPEKAAAGAFGGKEFSETARPGALGGETRAFEGQVPPAPSGTAPPGNLMDFMQALRQTPEGMKPARFVKDLDRGVSIGPPKPPRYQPFLRSGKFREIKSLDEGTVEAPKPSLLESANPLTEVPQQTQLGPKIKTHSWVARKWNRMKHGMDIVRQMEKRVEYEGSQSLIRSLQDLMRDDNRFSGSYAERLGELGIAVYKESLRSAATRKIKGIPKATVDEVMVRPAVHDFFVKVGEDLQAAGVTVRVPMSTEVRQLMKTAKLSPGGKSTKRISEIESARKQLADKRIDYNWDTGAEHYVRPFMMSESFLKTGPYRWNRNTLEAIWKDVGGLAQAADEIATAGGRAGNAKFITGTIDKIKDSYYFSKTTKKAIEALIDPNRGMFKTPGEAIRYLREEAGNQLFRRQGVENPRLSKVFPEEFRETNPATLLGRYVNEVSRAMAEIKTFGPDRSMLARMLDDIKAGAPEEYSMMSDLSDAVMGVVDRTRPISRKAFIAQRVYGKYVFGAKIGLGFAPIVQVTQPAISYIPDAGAIRSLKGAFKALNPEYRAFLRKQGVIGPSAFRRLMGRSDEGFLRYLPTTRFFDYANRILDYTAGATGQVFAKDLYRIANRDIAKAHPIARQRIKWARNKLSERFGIDHTKPLGDADFVRMTQDYAAFTQLHPNATKEPLWFNMPQTRWLASLKRFVYRQSLLAHEVILKDLARGNVFPLARAVLGGIVGGDLMMKARREIFDAVRGKPTMAPEGDFVTDDVVMALAGKKDFPWLEVANRYALIGTYGIFGDVGWVSEDDPAEQAYAITQNLEFTFTPVGFADIGHVKQIGQAFARKAGKATLGTEEQKEKTGAEELARTVAEDVLTMFGTAGYNLSSRFQSDETELKTNRKKYNDTLSKARRAYWGGNRQRASDIIAEWGEIMQYYPMELSGGMRGSKPISWGDVSDIKHKSSFK